MDWVADDDAEDEDVSAAPLTPPDTLVGVVVSVDLFPGFPRFLYV